MVVHPSTKPTAMSKKDFFLSLIFSTVECLWRRLAKKLWEKLGNLYQSKSLVNKLFLQNKSHHLRMKDGVSMTKHLNAFNTIVSQISVDIKMEEENNFVTLLCSLPD